MIQQGMNLPPHRPPNIDKPESIPNKIKETWDSILQFNRIQKFPYTNLQGVPKKIGILSSFEFLDMGGVFLRVKNNSKNFGNKKI